MDNIPLSDLGLNPTSSSLPPELTKQDTIEQILRLFSYDEAQLLSNTGVNDELKAFGIVDNDQGGLWVSPLHMAVQNGQGKIVRILLEHDADCNIKDRDGLTPLAHATIRGYEDVADLLLSHGASLRHLDHHHRSALHWAVLHCRDRLLKKLLKHCAGDSALINGYTKEGRTALHIAIDTGFEAAVEVLLKSGANVQCKARHDEGINETTLGDI
jgi:ankyrin repeat protein